MAILTTIHLPIDWESLGLPSPLQTRTTCLAEGAPAWGWEPDGPDLGIDQAAPCTGMAAEGWDIDHVVLLVPDMEDAVARVASTLGKPRLRTIVEGRATSFFRVGPILEIIQSPVRAPALYGIALVTTEPLEAVVLNWRSRGLTVTDPQPAIQPGRRIFTVRGTSAGLAIMSPDGARTGG